MTIIAAPPPPATAGMSMGAEVVVAAGVVVVSTGVAGQAQGVLIGGKHQSQLRQLDWYPNSISRSAGRRYWKNVRVKRNSLYI